VLSLPSSVRVFLCTLPADMRKGFDGLSAMAKDVFEADPLSGHLFVFRNRKRDRVKILWWDRSGYCLWYKRLERGRFHLPEATGDSLEVAWADLGLILEGIDLAGAKRRKRFSLKKR